MKIQLPVDQKLATRQKKVQWLSQLVSIQTPPDCEPSDLLEMGKLCELTNRFEFATRYYNRALDQHSDLCEKSAARFLLLVEFVRQTIARDELTLEQRGFIFSAALTWLEQQFAFASEKSECPSQQSNEDIKKQLLEELRYGESGKILKAGCSEQSLNAEQRGRFKELNEAIESFR